MSAPAPAPLSITPLKSSERPLWPWILWLLPALPLLALLISALEPQRQLSFRPTAHRSFLSEPFPLDAGSFGSPFLDVRATIPPNSTVSYRLELLDPAGQVVLHWLRDGWRETGTWREEGESGSYDESDTAVPLLLRPAVSGAHRLRLQVEDLRGTNGQPLVEPVSFQARLMRRRVNAPLLVLTAASGLVTSLCAWMAVFGPSRRRHLVPADGGRLQWRADLGPGLVRLHLQARYQSSTGLFVVKKLSARFRVRDGFGRIRLERQLPIKLVDNTRSFQSVRQGETRWLLRLSERCNVALQVEVPENPGGHQDSLQRLSLLVEDGVRQALPAPVFELDPPAPGA